MTGRTTRRLWSQLDSAFPDSDRGASASAIDFCVVTVSSSGQRPGSVPLAMRYLLAVSCSRNNLVSQGLGLEDGPLGVTRIVSTDAG
jgi:hypothetical protein